MCITEKYHYKTRIPIRFADIDAFGHVNNAIYLTYFEIARAAYWTEVVKWNWEKAGIIIRRSEIEYVKPVVLQDELFAYVRTSRVGNTSFDIEYVLVKKVNGREEICTTGSTQCVAFDYQNNVPVPIPSYQRTRMLTFEAFNVQSREFQV